jgi:hypothetical protein
MVINSDKKIYEDTTTILHHRNSFMHHDHCQCWNIIEQSKNIR